MTTRNFDPSNMSRAPGRSSRRSVHPVSHQTARLSAGKHGSPEQGVCVMELASMLAGEPFSDHPSSVCPVIGSLLRAYNDSVDDERRQDLCAYASAVVGSRSSLGLRRARAQRLADWTLERRRRWPHFLSRLRSRPQAVVVAEPSLTAGAHAARAIRGGTDRDHIEALALIDELLALDDADPAATSGVRSRKATARPLGRAEAPGTRCVERGTIQLLRARHTVT